MANITNLLTEHIDIWTAAESEKKSGRGRASGNPGSVYGVKKLRELIYELASIGALVQGESNYNLKLLGEVSEFVMGQAPPGSECNLQGLGEPFVKTGEFGELYPEIREWTTKPLKFAKKGDILICVVGATIGKLNLGINCSIGRSVAAIRPTEQIDTKYLYYMLMPFTIKLRQNSRGSAQGVIGKTELSAVKIRVPPLAEQHRIVAKVDELMALCDQLEQQHSSAQEAHETLVSQLLATLTQSQNAAEFDANWQRIYAHFDVLFTTEASIDALKQTLLQLAVMGKLVPQDPNDEPASELLKRIQAKKVKTNLVWLDFNGLEEIKKGIPSNWAWVRLGEIADIVRGGSPRPAGDLKFYDGNIPFLKVGDVTRSKGKMVDGFTSTIKPAGLIKTRFINKRTVLLTNSGATLGVPAICDFDTTFNDGIAAFINLSSDVFDEYLYLYLKSISAWFLDVAAQGQGQPNLNTDIIRSTWIPVTSLQEQRRIVAKVDALMALCDQLKTRIQQANQQQQAIADALVAQAVA